VLVDQGWARCAKFVDPILGSAVLKGYGDSSRGRHLRESDTLRARCCGSPGDIAPCRPAARPRLRRAGRADASRCRRCRDGRVARTGGGPVPRVAADPSCSRRDPGRARVWGLDQAAPAREQSRSCPGGSDDAARCECSVSTAWSCIDRGSSPSEDLAVAGSRTAARERSWPSGADEAGERRLAYSGLQCACQSGACCLAPA
jgi:hypothetical protein